MEKEQITKILSKIKDTVGENNYKLALAITGHRTGKIKDIIMCSKDGELLLEYVDNLEQQVKTQQLMINKAIDLLNAYIGVLDDTSDLYFENVKSILELEVKEVSE